MRSRCLGRRSLVRHRRGRRRWTAAWNGAGGTPGRHSLAQVARELDLRPEMLRRWKRQVEHDGEQAFPSHGRLKADDEQLRQLLRENQRLREKRDILKKAVAIFSERRR